MTRDTCNIQKTTHNQCIAFSCGCHSQWSIIAIFQKLWNHDLREHSTRSLKVLQSWVVGKISWNISKLQEILQKLRVLSRNPWTSQQTVSGIKVVARFIHSALKIGGSKHRFECKQALSRNARWGGKWIVTYVHAFNDRKLTRSFSGHILVTLFVIQPNFFFPKFYWFLFCQAKTMQTNKFAGLTLYRAGATLLPPTANIFHCWLSISIWVFPSVTIICTMGLHSWFLLDV